MHARKRYNKSCSKGAATLKGLAASIQFPPHFQSSCSRLPVFFPPCYFSSYVVPPLRLAALPTWTSHCRRRVYLSLALCMLVRPGHPREGGGHTEPCLLSTIESQRGAAAGWETEVWATLLPLDALSSENAGGHRCFRGTAGSKWSRDSMYGEVPREKTSVSLRDEERINESLIFLSAGT